MERLKVISLDEMSRRWQIPVERIEYLITECGLNPAKSAKWVEENKDLFLAEKQKAFEDKLFPKHLRPEPETAV